MHPSVLRAVLAAALLAGGPALANETAAVPALAGDSIAAPAPAHDEAQAVATHASDHHHYIGSLAAMWLSDPAHPAAQFGGTLGLEASLLPHLEAELELGLIPIHGELTLPVDLLAKVPFHFGHLQPFVGLGPTVVATFGDHAGLHAGVASCAGAYYWLSPHLGVSALLKYNVLFEEHVVQEAGASIGLVAGI